MASIFITCDIEKNGLDLLKRHEIEYVVNTQTHPLSSGHLKEIVKKFDGVICCLNETIDSEITKAAHSRFKVIANYGVGFDNIDVLAAKRRGIAVCNTPGVASESVAEHTFMLILACAKRVVEADRFVRAGKYTKWGPTLFNSNQLWGQTIGLLGLGRIGAYVGHIAHSGFGMKIAYHDIDPSPDFELLSEARFVSLENLLRESDVLSIHVPLNKQTRHLIGREEFRIMKDSAILVNTARGAIIDQEALIWALREKVIRAAGLDVFENEFSLPAEMKTLGNVIMTPHTASATIETREKMSEITAQNVIDVLSGEKPFGLVRVE